MKLLKPKQFPMNKIFREKKGFTLVELAIVLVIIGLITGAAVTLWRSTIDSTRLSTTKTNLDNIKNSVINFAIANGRLPCPDTILPPNNQGDANPAVPPPPPPPTPPFNCNCTSTCATPPCYVPFKTLQLQLPGGRDSFGNVFRYDVSHETTAGTGLTNTTQDTFCGVLFEYMSHGTDTGVLREPCVTNPNDAADNGQIGALAGVPQGYAIAAVIISETPINNVFNVQPPPPLPSLTGKNAAGTSREYEMANRTNDSTYGDLVAELTIGELFNRVCTTQKTKIRIQNNTGGQKCAQFGGSATLVPIPAASFVDLYQGSTVTFFTTTTTPCDTPCGNPITFNMSATFDAGTTDWTGTVVPRDGRVQITGGSCTLSDN
ncbi:MAG: hypothetical protein CO012_11935 [Syntrophobacterales bacterium CG_4_8_14_3_um_filter_49_14]|nr:MAG: hypothetical protein COX52_01340 [Syntrophobacterales bacterium CG23_combo_of_CG06-09_8_20_14_all_48_27]PJC72551.1 MAG: hypothetical protein CO012_11935 [Syntrophobacterales bacterium CG_4_8_14_3_um_filter_49_14]